MFLIGIKGLFFLLVFCGVCWGFWKFAHHTILTEKQKQELEDALIKQKATIKNAEQVEEVSDVKLEKAKAKIKRTLKRGES